MMLVSNDGIGQELDLMHTERNGYGKLMLILGPSVVYILYVIEREGERERDRESPTHPHIGSVIPAKCDPSPEMDGFSPENGGLLLGLP
jgi:hypothetical protein